VPGAIDYAAITTGVTAAQLAGTEFANMDLVPILGYAAFPCYNVRVLPLALTLIQRLPCSPVVTTI
jgi:hypothetical protein